MVQLLQQKLLDEKEDPSITRINQAILQARKHFPLAESAKAIQNAVFLKRQTYFALYAKKEEKEDGFEVEPDCSFKVIQVAFGDRFPHFQLFESGKLLLFASSLTYKKEKLQLQEIYQNAIEETQCSFHSFENPSDNPFFEVLNPFYHPDCICKKSGKCAFHILQRIFENLGDLPISYLYDGSQSGAQVEKDIEDEIVRFRVKNTTSIDYVVCLVHPIGCGFPYFHRLYLL